MSKKIKLIHVISSLKRGGAEQVLMNLLEFLPKDIYEHQVIYFHEGPHQEKLRALMIPHYHIKGLISLYDPIFFLRLWWQLFRLKPDVVHSSLWSANWCARLVKTILRFKLVHAYHNCAELDGNFRNKLDYISFAYKIPSIAASQKAALSLAGKGICLQKIQVIINGSLSTAQDNQLPLEYSRSALGINSDDFVVGSVGRLEAVKNHAFLIQAFYLLLQKYKNLSKPSLKLILVGDGAERSNLEKLAHELGISDKVMFAGSVPADHFYHFFDCFVLPSLSEGGISLALQDAMHRALPCIVSQEANVDGIIVDGQSGWVIPSEKVADLASILECLITRISEGNQIGIQGKNRVGHMASFTDMIDRYDHVFRGLVEK